ncbi:oxygenase MpaB family protein [Saccharopolyspora sp. CA-218241]|uniref:oxygenase MpaB family protein n=1 Tax=Saccharopolyspora sp. CA-218241 TaxID=3240027 RepID=UPI003D986114
MTDAGVFGPDTVTWQLHADPAMWVAGIASLHLQALHPRAVAGVVQNSRFQADPLGRLLRTSGFVGVSTYGTREEVERAAARVRRVHRVLTAVDRRDGSTIRLDEPDLLRWVHCAEVAMFAAVVRRAGFPLTDRLCDRYFDEQRRSAALVGLDPADVPGSRREMAAYFAEVRPQLRRTADADLVRRFLHHPFTGARAWPVNLGYRPVGHLAYSALPGWARRLHGQRAYPGAATTAGLVALRSAGLAIPAELRRRKPHGQLHRAVRRLGPGAVPSARRLSRLGG